MDFNEMKKIKNDTELVDSVYNFFDEKSRLNCSTAAKCPPVISMMRQDVRNI